MSIGETTEQLYGKEWSESAPKDEVTPVEDGREQLATAHPFFSSVKGHKSGRSRKKSGKKGLESPSEVGSANVDGQGPKELRELVECVRSTLEMISESEGDSEAKLKAGARRLLGEDADAFLDKAQGILF